MHVCTTPVGHKHLLDPGACRVRLGIELRADAEQQAYSEGMVLSLWIRKVVQEAVRRSKEQKDRLQENEATEIPVPEPNSFKTDADREFQRNTENANDR
jgi:hypothetical protein